MKDKILGVALCVMLVLAWWGTNSVRADSSSYGNGLIDLGDMSPKSYSGQAGKTIVVNGTENGVTFGAAPGGGGGLSNVSTLSGLNDVSTAGVATNNLLYYDSSLTTWKPISLADLSASETFVPVSSIITSGTLAAGNYTSMAAPMDNEIYQITEAAATPGIDVRLVYSGVTDLNSINLYALYSGGVTAHEVAIQVYNWTTSTWDTYGYIEVSTVYLQYPEHLLTPSNYLSNGYVWVRLLHSDVGNPSHNLYIDYASVTTGVGAGSTSQFVTDAVFDDHTGNTTTAHGLSTYQRVCTVNAITNYTFDGTETRNAGYGVNTATGNKTINIDPDLFSTGTEFSICKSTSDANTVTLDSGSGNTIDGSQTYVIQTYNQVVTLIRSAANTWKVKSGFLEQAALLANYTTKQGNINSAYDNFTTAYGSKCWKLAFGGAPVDVFTGTSTFTIRTQVHSEVGGDALRVSWLGGPSGITINSASIGIAGASGTVTNLKRLTHNNNTSFSAGARELVYTDPIFGTYSANTDFYVTAYVTGNLVEYKSYYQTYKDYSNKAMSTAALDVTVPMSFGYSYYGPNGLEVRQSHKKFNSDCWLAIADSIGAPGGSMINQLQQFVDVYNSGHISNRADVEVPQVKFKLQYGPKHTVAIIELGSNDIANSKTAEQVATDISKIIKIIRDAGITNVIVATISPRGDLTAGQEAQRGLLNQKIRSWVITRYVDGLLDMDVILRDPANPAQLLAAYDSGDGIHPNQAGQDAMFAKINNPDAPSDIYLTAAGAKTSLSIYTNYSSATAGPYPGGSDSTGFGTYSTAFQTINKALSYVDSSYSANITIYTAPAIYTEEVIVNGKQANGDYNLTIQGHTTTNDSGTADGSYLSFPNLSTVNAYRVDILVDSSKSWTPDAYAGKQLRVTQADGAYEYYHIKSNTATALTIYQGFKTNPNGLGYVIRTLNTTIDASGNTNGILVKNSTNIIINDIIIKSATLADIEARFSDVTINGCRLTDTVVGAYGRTWSDMFVYGCELDNSTFGAYYAACHGEWDRNYSHNNTYGLFNSAGTMRQAFFNLIDTCATGIKCVGRIYGGLKDTAILNSTTYGLWATDSGSALSTMQNCVIKSSSGTGLYVESFGQVPINTGNYIEDQTLGAKAYREGYIAPIGNITFRYCTTNFQNISAFVH